MSPKLAIFGLSGT